MHPLLVSRDAAEPLVSSANELSPSFSISSGGKIRMCLMLMHKVINLLKLRHKTLVKFVEFQIKKLLSAYVDEMSVSNETQTLVSGE